MLSVDIATDSQPSVAPSNMFFKLIDRQPICRLTLGRHVMIDSRWCIGQLSVMHWSTVGDVSVDCRW